MTRYDASFTSFTCDAFADRLADFLERDVDETTRAAMEAHAVACGDCGPLLADLRKLRVDAALLPPLAPSRDLWAGIAQRIEAPVVEIGGRQPVASAARRSAVGGRRMPDWLRMGLAAAALVGLTAGVTYHLTRTMLRPASTQVASKPQATPAPARDGVLPTVPTRQLASATPAASASTPAPQDVERHDADRRPPTADRSRASLVANRHGGATTPYDRDVARLRAIIDRRRARLDPATVAVIEHNLAVIDDAIAQCRAALVKDPASRFLIESLNDALQSKIELMRTAATLPRT